MPSIVKARSAGILYLAILILAGFNLFLVPAVCIVPGDPAATARKLMANELVYRFGILSDVVGAILFVFMILVLYRLFKDVDQMHARLMVVSVSIAIAFALVNDLNQLAPLLLLNARDFSGLTQPQLETLALAFLRLRAAGFEIVEAFWALGLYPIGMLVIKSRFLPRVIGILLIAASFAGLAYSFGLIVMPDRRQIITLLTMPIDSIGELSLAIWLLIRGARVPQTSHAVSAI
jgi:uncharacterized protein DUF4386